MTLNSLGIHFGHLLGEKFIHTFVHSPHKAVLLTVLGDDAGCADLQVKHGNGDSQRASFGKRCRHVPSTVIRATRRTRPAN